MEPRIFVCYRRDDSAGHAGRIVDALEGRFGKKRIFQDIRRVEPGSDYVDAIEEALSDRGTIVAVIGKNWLQARDENGQRRLDDPEDFIRRELSFAIHRHLRVIPVLVQRAPMPTAAELPADLAPLARIQALRLSDERWKYDIGLLLRALGGGSRRARRRLPLLLGSLLIAAILAGIYFSKRFLASPGISDLGDKPAAEEGALASETRGYYLLEDGWEGMLLLPGVNFGAAATEAGASSSGGFDHQCLRRAIEARQRIRGEDLDDCEAGYYAKEAFPHGKLLCDGDLIEVGSLPERPRPEWVYGLELAEPCRAGERIQEGNLDISASNCKEVS